MKYKQLILGILIGVVGVLGFRWVNSFFGYNELHIEKRSYYQDILHSDLDCENIREVITKSIYDEVEVVRVLQSHITRCHKCMRKQKEERTIENL